MIFYFTKTDVFMAPEKSDEYRIVFKFHILKLVVSFLTLPHCLVSIGCGLGARAGSGHGRGLPLPAPWAAAWSLPPKSQLASGMAPPHQQPGS